MTLKPYDWSRLIAEEGKALLSDPLNIMQYPYSFPKQIVFWSNQLVDLTTSFAHDTGNTE